MPMNPEVKIYLHSLIDLHDQISQGKGDDQEADDIRDGMDIPCRKISDNDTDIGSMISVLLYLLDGQDKEPTPREAAKDKAWRLLVKFVSHSKMKYLEEAARLLTDDCCVPESPENNEERIKLIEKKYSTYKHGNGLSEVEEERLKVLQDEARDEVALHHPLPPIATWLPLTFEDRRPLTTEVTIERSPSWVTSGTMPIIDLMILAKHAESRAYARRLVNGGGVSIDGKKVERASEWVPVKTGMVLKTGKRKFARIVVTNPNTLIKVNGESMTVPTAERLTYEKICELAGDPDHTFSVVWRYKGRSGISHKGSPDIRPEDGLLISACNTGNA